MVVVVVVVVVGAFVVVVVAGAIVVVVVGALVVVVVGAIVVVVVGAFVVVVVGAIVVVVAIAAAKAVVVTTAAGANPARTVVAGAAVTGPTPDVVVFTGTIVDETTVDEVGAMVDGIVDEGVKGDRAEVLDSELPTTVVVDRMVEVAGKTVLGVWGIPIVDDTNNAELTGLRAVVVEFAGREPEMGRNSVLVEPPEASGATEVKVEVVVEVEVVVDWELAIGANCALTAAGAFGIPITSTLIKAETVTTQTGATSLDNERSAQKQTNDWRYWANRNRRSATISAREQQTFPLQSPRTF